MLTENQNKLISAIENNNIDEIKDLITKEPDILNKVIDEKKGLTPIFYATLENKKEIFDLLVFNGAHLNTILKNKSTLLHYASFLGNTEIIKTLLDKKLDVNAKNTDDMTPLLVAAKNGKKEAFDLLLQNNADLNAKDTYNNTLLHYAAISGNTEIIKTLLDKKLEVSAKNNHEMTPVLFAAKNGKKEAFDLLVASGAEIIANENNIVKFLMNATIGGNVDILNSILEKNPDPTNKNAALYAAVISNKAKVVEFFIKKRASANLTDDKGKTLLHFAIEKSDASIIQILIDKGADVNAEFKNDKGNLVSALAQAAGIYGDKPRPEIVSLLLKNGAKLEGNIGISIAVSLIFAAIATAITAVILAIASAPFWILAPVAAGVALFILGVSVYDIKTKNDAILKIAKDFEAEQEAKYISGDKSKTQEPAKATGIIQEPTSQRAKLDGQNQILSINNER